MSSARQRRLVSKAATRAPAVPGVCNAVGLSPPDDPLLVPASRRAVAGRVVRRGCAAKPPPGQQRRGVRQAEHARAVGREQAVAGLQAEFDKVVDLVSVVTAIKGIPALAT
eukprot:CAMPEP_0177233664 /NCGR_PEP_ID=MMETSP0367-20130122/43986_1 /TAXON_ID=447022 ORGANISM="Scrippsiella hangoei-like, Strain SHHI-4" /NCGR_SAMPLE_ID=MMETSP0367 /ASSEMBLY_ACC=CAM_ASM_000362 /LENGTH=110 /DNA_ID=CAMNT_0018684411 /DNA_START=151 /DNA_END=484 /DNA_ORIENTATION=+